MTKTGFSKGWSWENGSWIKVGPYKPTVVLDKTPNRDVFADAKTEMMTRFRMLNHPKMEELMNDKYLTYLAFEELSVETKMVHSTSQAIEAVKTFRTKKVIVKPNSEFGGRGVRVVLKDEIGRERIEPNSIVQPFLDSSKGIPGIYDDTHDLRVGVLNGDITYSYFRTPPKKSLIANFSTGGTNNPFPISKLPNSVRDVVKKVDEHFRPVGSRFYVVDFMFNTRGRPIIVELNSRPGIVIPKATTPALNKALIKWMSAAIRRAKSV